MLLNHSLTRFFGFLGARRRSSFLLHGSGVGVGSMGVMRPQRTPAISAEQMALAKHNCNWLVTSITPFSRFFSSGAFGPPPLISPRRVVVTVTDCATGAHSIGDAFRMVQFGDADAMVAGGTEASIDALSIVGFCRSRALTTRYNEVPEEASRPFDCGRDGFVISEGSGILVLEELEHAKKRGAKVYAEIRGYGMSGDAYHITQPHGDGRGAVLAMTRALEQSGLKPNQVDYINAHATSTPLGDAIEAKAIQSLFCSRAVSGALALSSTKVLPDISLGQLERLKHYFLY